LGLKPSGHVLPFAQMFSGGGSMTIMKIAVSDGTEEIPYIVNSDLFVTKLVTNKGSVHFTLDKDANALRIKGDVPQLRLSSDVAHGVNSFKYPDGAETGLGGRIVYKITRGTFSFDDTWVLTNWSNVAPCLDVFPDAGSFELACIALEAEEKTAELTKSFSECSKDNKADFEKFKATLLPTDDITAYKLWASPQKTSSVDLAEESWQFADPSAVYDRVLASAESGKKSVVPKFAAAALRLIEAGFAESIPDSKLKMLGSVLQESLEWWNTYRFDPDKGRYFYAYRSETGETNPLWFDRAPVYAPDLQERISQLTAAAAKFA